MKQYHNYINGDWIEAIDSQANINPSDLGDTLGHYARADQKQTQEAIDCAHHAFQSWSMSSIQTRFNCLDMIGSEILARKEELGSLLAREEGKPIAEATGEVIRAGQIFKFYAGEALRLQGEHLPSVRPNISVEVNRSPLGVVGIITPWNFPIAIPAWKIAPALAYGNTVVFKPAELTPGSAWALAEIISRSGLPEGVFNLVMGAGTTVGQTFINSPKVAGITFTGSQSTGGRVAQACVSRGAKFQLEMGGKNPLVVLKDSNLTTAVEYALNGAYFSTGQRCTASSRLIIEDAIHDQFVDALTEKLTALKVGNALDKTTQLGPVASQSQLDQNMKYIAIGQDEGATEHVRGGCLDLATPGHYMSPSLFIETDNKARINQEEIFGPIATTIRVADLEEAIATANDTPFGLSAGICTASLSSATKFKTECEAGMVMINLPTAGVDYHVPFGGTKQSSYGSREQGRYAAEFYTSVKTAYIGT
ncbi:aldehyde dehydrogenase family protein [Temperatibacter marinus]|uniref:Aldehyde dehydrogenase family protein n=1 Tax=Temperatibacter marinus TaxID=1456591 RepID=A0AA52EFJ5_9PROT|nr:aldehyde dehydrogenase family protein [Temperatibacter marinus]WND03856.1 aldehyde dehydrogenase family protein [Temperatibacter marinus]